MKRKPRPAHIAVWLCILALMVGGSAWAWGDWRGLLSHPARAGALGFWVCLAAAGLFSGASGLSGGKREDRRNRWTLVALAAAWLLIVFAPPYFDRRAIWTLDGDAVRYFGLVLFIAGGVLRLGSVYTLGHRFSGVVAIQEDHALQTDGLYRLIRHPSYLGMLVLLAGWALVFRSGVGLLLVGLVLAALVGRMRAEEAFLAAEFGAEYAAYRQRTWRLVPYLY